MPVPERRVPRQLQPVLVPFDLRAVCRNAYVRIHRGQHHSVPLRLPHSLVQVDIVAA